MQRERKSRKHINGGYIGNIHKYVRTEDVPAKTMFVITTDGMENASRMFSYAQVEQLIEAKKEEGCEL